MSLNLVVVTGRLGGNPEIIMFETGKQRTRFTLAVNRDYKSENGERPIDWIPVVCWGKGGANYAQTVHLAKGDEMTVTGRLENASWTDENGQKRTGFYINVEHMYLTAKKRSKDGDNGNAKAEGNQSQQQTNNTAYQNEFDAQMQKDLDDLPF